MLTERKPSISFWIETPPAQTSCSWGFECNRQFQRLCFLPNNCCLRLKYSHKCNSNRRGLQGGDKVLLSPGSGEWWMRVSRIFFWPFGLPWSAHRTQIDIIPTFLWYLLPWSWCEGFFNMNSVKGETYYCRGTLLCRECINRWEEWRDMLIIETKSSSFCPDCLPFLFKQPSFFLAINTKFFLVKWSAFMLPERSF